MKFRPNVAAVVCDREKRLLIGRRADFPDCWQFPQGGVDRGETPEEALFRELNEEVSLHPADYRVEGKFGPYRYEFGNGRNKNGYDGQEQFYFLVRLVDGAGDPDTQTKYPEFSELRWITPEEFRFEWVPEFKRPVYRDVFRDIFGIRENGA